MFVKYKNVTDKIDDKGGGNIISRDKVPCLSISGQYEIICREKIIFCDRNGKLFYLVKVNWNVAGVNDMCCRHCNILSQLAWSKSQ